MVRSLLILTRTFPPDAGAVGHLVKEWATALSKNGNDVTVVAAGRQVESAVQSGNFRVIRAGGLPFTRKNNVLRAFSYLSLYPAMFWAAARQARPEVIVTTTDPPLQAVLGVLLKWRFRCRLIHWCQDLYPEVAEAGGVLSKNGWLGDVLRWISTRSLDRHDRIISIGRCMTNRLRDRELDDRKIAEIANWTDPIAIFPVEQAESRLARKEGLTDSFVVGYSGNLGLSHSFWELLEAAEILQVSHPEIVFTITGEGSRLEEVRRVAETKKLANVRFFPPQAWSDISDAFGATHLQVVSLLPEMSGLVVPSKFYGILAAGRTCLYLGLKNSEIGQLILENHVGKIIPPGDAKALVAAILGYLENRPQLACEAKNARRLGLQAGFSAREKQFSEVIEASLL